MKRTIPLVVAILALACLLPAQNAPLTLTAPNGGEVWNTGSTHAITWTHSNLTGSVSLMLLGANSAAPGNVVIAQAVPVEAGTYDWTIPATVPPGTQYRVRIASTGNNGVYAYDMSDGAFSIQNSDPPPPQTYITVTSPNGGEIWPAGSTQNITWNYQNLEGEVRITLIRPNDNQQIVVTEAAPIASGTYAWTIPANIAPGMYKVHVQWLTILAVYFGDVSDDFFSITGTTPPPPPTLTVTSPNGGETWMAGTMHPITWDYFGNGGFVMIQLMGGPEMAPIVVIAHSIPANAGIFHWNIPPYQMPGNAYQVQINLINPNGTYVGDISDAPFSIIENYPPPQSITVTSPNGGETWVAGTMHPITWNYTGLTGEVYIGLIAENMNSINIIMPAISIGAQHYDWSIPADIMPGRYMVQVVWITDLTVFIGDISDGYFYIVGGNQPPAIHLVSPDGGETWIIGESYPIQWMTAMPGGVVTLTLSGVNDPAAYNMIIAENIPALQHPFMWIIPDNVPAGSNYQMTATITLPDGTASTDASDGTFTIIVGEGPPPQTIAVTSPNGGEQWLKGSWHDITWDGAEPNSIVRIALVYGEQAPYRRRVIARNAPNTGTYHWRVPYRLPAGEFYRVMIKRAGGSSDASDGFFSILAPNYSLKATPNPTVQGTKISFEMDEPSSASVRIYNIKGQCVRTLVNSQTLSGSQSLYWDGNDQQGRKVSAGLYFARISLPEASAVQKIIVLK